MKAVNSSVFQQNYEGVTNNNLPRAIISVRRILRWIHVLLSLFSATDLKK